MTARRHVFVTPPLDGPPTGGTIYDAELIRALVRAQVPVRRVDLDAASRALSSGAVNEAFWVDSLYLDALPALARHAGSCHSVGLIAHYLPSLVASGAAFTPAHLTSVERAALDAGTTIVVPSPWFRDVIESVGVSCDRIRVVEPGIDDVDFSVPRPMPGGAPLAALLVGNVVPGKGIAPFLEALAAGLAARPSPVVVVIVGSLEEDVQYVAECRAMVRARPSLEGAVHFASVLPHAEVIRAMRQSDVLVSASRMESYGMALAEARSLGLPILARRGGNAPAHVDPVAGGELFEDDAALSEAVLRMSRDRDELARRRLRATSQVRRRTWDAAARDFLEW